MAKDIELVFSPEEFEIDKRNKLGNLLGIVSRFEHENRRPMLSAIVIAKDTKRPGNGFFELARELKVLKKEDNESFWINQYKALRKYWKN